MSNRVVAGILTAVAISVVLSDLHAIAATTAKARKSTTAVGTKKSIRVAHVGRRHVRRTRSAGLIPPPPAYMPCILPELYYRNTGSGVTEIATTVKKENPYKQYVSTPNGDAPEAISTRKGVVTWHRRG